MTTKKYAKNLTAGDLIDYDGPRMIAEIADYGNGWLCLYMEDGTSMDCLAYTSFDTLL